MTTGDLDRQRGQISSMIISKLSEFIEKESAGVRERHCP